MRFTSKAILIAAVIACLLTDIRGEQPPPSLPNTVAGKLMREWVPLFNAQDTRKLEDFVKTHYTDSVLHGRQPGEIAASQVQLRRNTGALELVAVEKSSNSELVAIWRSQSVLPQFVRVAWQVNESDPEHIVASSISPTTPPESLHMGRLPLAELTTDLNTKLEELTRRDQFSGAVMIAKEGKPVWQKAYGLADRERKLPATLDTRFRLGSMNKMFTAVSVAQLVEKNKLKFSDTIAGLLPDYPNKEVAQKITVHQLLTHTSGLGDIFGPKFGERRNSLHELKDYLPLFASEPLRFEPGADWSYSNAGFIVLGLIIEKVSGENYYDYVQHHIYDVAGMKNSGDLPVIERPPNLAVGYMADGGTLKPNWETLPWRGMSAGGGDSTVGDLLRFANALRSNALVSAGMTSTITTGKVSPAGNSPAKYAYGFGDNVAAGRRIVGHGGGAPGMNAQLSMVWDNGYTVIALANLDPPIAENIVTYILSRLSD